MTRDTHDHLPLEAYLPHRGRMLLLDRVLEAGPGRMLCAVSLRADSPFCRDGRVPAYIGIEYMAQATGALVGWQSMTRGQPVRVGFLISVRKYSSRVNHFSAGTTLRVESLETLRDEEFGSMMCSIYNSDDELPIVKAQLNAYSPLDLKSFLANQ